MKRTDLLRHLAEHGCLFLREGSDHTIYWNPNEKKVSAIPRHRELNDYLANKICKDLGVQKP